MLAAGRLGIVRQMRTFIPTARQTNWLLIVGFLAVGEALYVRYLAIEHAPVSLACQASQNILQSTWLCATFHLAIAAYNNSVFGWVAVIAAALNLVRPSILLMTVAIAAAGTGLVLHNAGLAGLAAGLLILSLARPTPAAD
ncbi:MAG TPA: hypothetical protein VF897_20810 [Roseiflexaceae bacterium]